MKDNKPGLFTSVRASAILKREEMLGYHGQADGWTIKTVPTDFHLEPSGEMRFTLRATLKKDGEEVANVLDYRPSLQPNRPSASVDEGGLDVDTLDWPESARAMADAQSTFLHAPSTVLHYADLATAITPLAKAKMVKEMLPYVEPAKALAQTLAGEILTIERAATQEAVRTVSRGR
jgi:hypothetical protein